MLRAQTDWHLTARYIYALGLDGPSWAWEWLRRNRAYQTDWTRARQRGRRRKSLVTSRRSAKDRAAPWGLIALENPETSAQDAAIFWQRDAVAGLLRAGIRPRRMIMSHPMTFGPNRAEKPSLSVATKRSC